MASKLFDMTGKVAVVTGSSRGIGRAIAQELARAGASVVVSSRKAEACDKVRAEIEAQGGTAAVIPCNISSRDECEALIRGTMARFGRIDALVCNAAVNPYFGPIADVPDAAFDKIMASNIKSNLWLCQLARPALTARGGAILIISSIGGLRGSALLGAYCISKAADMQLARNLAVEWGGEGIRTNCIAPGLIRTDFARALWENPDIEREVLRNCPAGRIGEPEDIAGAALFLVSDAGRYTNGQTLAVDGGVTIAGG
ncbi:SDR family NAD(P)-dependent oxidoreductase [Zavarzinia aquatilis]|uniref:Short-chain dehydrogenase n=1 Tax=Zavarzinia aquatilis TaxID=2211142 RepID=A0A317E712_9PROT|nr:SDR family oxidoreductase [Zavarzinia aquatilis]PWR22827.1 short-chain dehydrogenase [Zavarzinia aquatilis]